MSQPLRIINWFSAFSQKMFLFLNNWYGQLLLFFILVFLVLNPILIKDCFFFQGDSIQWSYPDLFFYQQAIKNQESFFWNPYLLSGFPTFLSSGVYLSPLFYLPFIFFDFLTVYHWLIFLNLVLAGFLTTRLLIYFKISSFSALVGGLSYVLGSKLLLTDLVVINYLPLLPILVWLIIFCYEKNVWWPVFVGGFLTYLILISVHFNWQLILFATGLIFTLFYPWVKREGRYKNYLKLFVKYILMVLIGFLLAFPYLLSLATYLPSSYRGGGLNYLQATSGSTQVLDFFNFFLPYFNPPFFASGTQFYFGILPLFFFIFSLVLFKKERLVKFLILIFLLCLLVAIKYSPLFWLMQRLPLISSFRGPSRWMALGLFSASILAAIGLENFSKTDFQKFKNNLLKIFKYLTIILILFSLIFNLINYFFSSEILKQVKNYFDQNLYEKTTKLPLEHYHEVIEQVYNNLANLISFGNLKFIFPLLIIIISYLAIEFFTRKKQYQNYFQLVIFLVVIINFILIMPFSYRAVSRQIFDYKPNIAKRILTEPGRIFSFLPGFTEFDKLSTIRGLTPEQIFIFQSELLTPNISAFYKIKTVDGHNSLMSQRYAEILALIGSDRAVTGKKLSETRIPLPDKIKLFRERLNLLDLLGVKYFISAYPVEDGRLEKVFEVQATDYKIPLYLYQNKKSLPEIYFAKNVDFLKPKKDKENFMAIVKKENDFNQLTYIECSDCQRTEELINSKIQIREEKNGYWKIKIDNQNSGWLILNQSNLPGWEATIDGRTTSIHNANYIFQAVLVPAGEHEVIFKYRPLKFL